MIPPSAFLWGALLLQLGPPLQVLYVVCGVHLSGGNRVFVDACIWDEVLVTAVVLERTTLAFPHWLIPRLFLVDETILFCATNTSTASAAPDARSLQDPAKDPRLKMSGRRYLAHLICVKNTGSKQKQ